MARSSSAESGKARPFLKWAGGKTQLLNEFARRFPQELEQGEIRRYVEPFVGGGAVYFAVNGRFPVRECHIWDANPDLVAAYGVIKAEPGGLITALRAMEAEYHARDAEGRRDYYYHVRDLFNRMHPAVLPGSAFAPAVERIAALIFLNRTCYNGLYRVNSRGVFNVPFGKYRNPRILDEAGLLAASAVLGNTGVHLGDFTLCAPYVDAATFVYLDPPYRPLSRTSSFTSYARGGFSEGDQRRLAVLFRALDQKGARLMLSNSDPKNRSPKETFFEDLYEGYRIERVPARRSINSVGRGRGAITELIITNY